MRMHESSCFGETTVSSVEPAKMAASTESDVVSAVRFLSVRSSAISTAELELRPLRQSESYENASSPSGGVVGSPMALAGSKRWCAARNAHTQRVMWKARLVPQNGV
jgi:hypothetical protein